jgi:hypothetical protein
MRIKPHKQIDGWDKENVKNKFSNRKENRH